MAYSSILDAILNEPRHPKTGSGLGDALLDEPSRQNYARTPAGARAKAVASGEDSLAEAAASTSTKQALSSIKTIEQALKFAKQLPTIARDRPLEQRRKMAKAGGDRFKPAVDRLVRLANKSAAQMKQDGATKLADYLDAATVPAWAKQARADLAVIQAVHLASLGSGGSIKQASTEEVLKERKLSDEEVAGYVKKLLSGGATPKDALKKLEKLAELQLFDRSFATEKLRSDANLAGVDFMEPNAYMEGGPDYERQEVKLGKGGSTNRPRITFDGITDLKTAGQVREWAARIVRRAALAQNRPQVAVKHASAASVDSRSGFSRMEQEVSIRTSATKEVKKASKDFTADEVLKRHNAGQDIHSIHREGAAKVGSARADQVMIQFVAGLKGTKTKVALTQIDCTLLPQKLGTSNGIIGASKCASCVYRKGMHCGFTGGTLLSFPGLDKTSNNHIKHASSPKDGYGLLNEYEMTKKTAAHDIDISGPAFMDVDWTGGGMDLE